MENIVRNRKNVTEEESEEGETLLKPSEKVQITEEKNGHAQKLHIEHTVASQLYPTLPITLRAMRITLYFLTKLLNVVYVPLFVYRMFEKTRRCTPVNDDLLMIPVNELTRRIRKKEVSCEQVIRSYITRIKEVNPLLNAVIDERFSDAIEEAKEVDQMVSAEDFLKNEEGVAQQFPLLGVPLTVKGSIAVKGLNFTSGNVARKDIVAEDDAVAVDLARKAGAIPILVSNIPELCMNWETKNKLIGTTRNPYDSTRTCGGSSGGEASLISSGGSLIGIGSDIAGSLRLPAHYCGVWGHKPTPGVVSFIGHYPSCSNHDQWQATFTVGPMARYAGDLRTLLGVISNPDTRTRLGLGEKVKVKTIKMYYTDMENYYWGEPSEPCSAVIQRVVDYFRTVCDSPPEKVDFPLFQYATDLATLTLLDIDNIDNLFGSNGNGFYSELFRYTTFRSKHSLSTIAYGMLRKLNSRVSKKHKQSAKNSLETLRREIEKTLGKDGILIMPTFPVEAIKHRDWLRYALAHGYMSIFNVLGFPVTNCPVGMTKDGLPLGIQVVSLPYSDKLTLRVAEQIEDAFGGWRTPESDV